MISIRQRLQGAKRVPIFKNSKKPDYLYGRPIYFKTSVSSLSAEVQFFLTLP
jgi:hypothetical protein